MKVPRAPWFVALLTPLLMGCDIDATPGRSAPPPLVEPDTPTYGLRGTWLAVDIIVTSVEAPSRQVSLVPQGGVFSLRIHDDQTYVLLASLKGGPADREQGTLIVGDSILILTASHVDRPSRVFAYTFLFDRLTLEFLQDFDVDGDGVDEPANFYTELVDLEFGYQPGPPQPGPFWAPHRPTEFDQVASRSLRPSRWHRPNHADVFRWRTSSERSV